MSRVWGSITFKLVGLNKFDIGTTLQGPRVQNGDANATTGSRKGQ